MKMFRTSLRGHEKKITNFEKKKKNATVKKRRTKITSRCKSILYLWKNNFNEAP